jgi:hypothetical protein
MSSLDVLQSWRVDSETNGHTPTQTIGFVSKLMDAADADAGIAVVSPPRRGLLAWLFAW